MSQTNLASTGFDRFQLDDSLLRAVHAAGFQEPRSIQSDTIPAGLEGRDVLGLAQTGTGKTAAFALPLIQRLLNRQGRRGIGALVLAPTRELASQIAEEIRDLSKFTKLKTLTIYGGVAVSGQVHQLRRRPDIIVGCPGRVLDLIGQGRLNLRSVEVLVLDEADHMFDMGFLPDIRSILGELPQRRQNLLFSATMPSQIRHLADDLLHQPHVVELTRTAPASTVDHGLYLVHESRKHDLLERLLGDSACRSAIVFTRTKFRAKRLADRLKKAGHQAVALQGNMSQSQRDRAMRSFQSGCHDVLVATDIASRGIDVSGVTHVINFDAPNTPEAYTHRLGRTGRSENAGTACTFVTQADRSWVSATERTIGDRIERKQLEGFELEEDRRGPERRPHRGQKQRPGKRRAARPKRAPRRRSKQKVG